MATKMRLTSKYAQGVMGADGPAAVDAEGNDWYLCGLLAPLLSDETVPKWPTCLGCGREVDVLHEEHWSMEDGDLDVVAHLQCVELVYPDMAVE